MMPDLDLASANGHVVRPEQQDDIADRLAERYREGATLDQLAVEFHMPPSRCRQTLLQAGVTLRSTGTVRSGQWFDVTAIPLERQREIAEAYRAFPGYEVAAAYGIPLPWVEKIAHLYGVRKAAPRGYRKRRGRSSQPSQPVTATNQTYLATLVVEASVEAVTWEAALAQLRAASPTVQVVRVRTVQRLVATSVRRQR